MEIFWTIFAIVSILVVFGLFCAVPYFFIRLIDRMFKRK